MWHARRTSAPKELRLGTARGVRDRRWAAGGRSLPLSARGCLPAEGTHPGRDGPGAAGGEWRPRAPRQSGSAVRYPARVKALKARRPVPPRPSPAGALRRRSAACPVLRRAGAPPRAAWRALPWPPVYATRPGGGGREGGAASAPGRPRTAAAPARRRLSGAGWAAAAEPAPGPARPSAAAEPSRWVPPRPKAAGPPAAVHGRALSRVPERRVWAAGKGSGAGREALGLVKDGGWAGKGNRRKTLRGVEGWPRVWPLCGVFHRTTLSTYKQRDLVNLLWIFGFGGLLVAHKRCSNVGVLKTSWFSGLTTKLAVEVAEACCAIHHSLSGSMLEAPSPRLDSTEQPSLLQHRCCGLGLLPAPTCGPRGYLFSPQRSQPGGDSPTFVVLWPRVFRSAPPVGIPIRAKLSWFPAALDH